MKIFPNPKIIQRKNKHLPPGTLVFTGKKKVDKILVELLSYNEAECKLKTIDKNYELIEHSLAGPVNWVDIRGLHDTEAIQLIGKSLKIHTLALEDAVDIHQRPKLEQFPHGIFFSFKGFRFGAEEKMNVEHLALFVGENFVVSFQEQKEDIYSAIKRRIQESIGRIRRGGIDYLLFALVDHVVDEYYTALDALESNIEQIEDDIYQGKTDQVKSKIYQLKNGLVRFIKHTSPLKESINQILKLEDTIVSPQVLPYYSDLLDHLSQIHEMQEGLRERLNSLQDLYLAEISMKLNEVMKVLTIITTLFVPLSFLAGLYGMNFKNMPELESTYGYYILLIVMAILFATLLYYFRKKKWL